MRIFHVQQQVLLVFDVNHHIQSGWSQILFHVLSEGSRCCKGVDWVDLRPVIVGRIQDVRSGNCDVVVDAGYCDVVSVVLAGRYRIGLSYG